MPGLGLSADRGKRKYRLCRRRGGGGLDASIQSSSSAPFSSLAMLASLAVAMAIFFILVLLDVFQSELIVSEGVHVAGGVVECMVRKIHHSMSFTRVREPTRRGISDNDDSRQSTQSVNCNQVPPLMADKPPLQIVILAGQSNMVGMGSMEHLDLLVHEGCRPRNTAGGGTNPLAGRPRRRRALSSPPSAAGGGAALHGKANGVGTATRSPRLHRINSDSYRIRLCNESSHSYKVSDRVYVKFGDASGRLTAGPNSGYAARGCFGPELMVGWTLHDEAKVRGSIGSPLPSRDVAARCETTAEAENNTSPTFLLVKTAWGGKSLAVDFRPPSSGVGNYSSTSLQHRFGRLRPLDYGRYYRAMIDDILRTLDNLSEYVPEYDSRFSSYRLTALVWLQGWNDLVWWPFVEEYGRNLENLIRDVRADLSSPDLPVVIGELGQHGAVLDPRQRGTPRVLAMRMQQRAVTLLPDFCNTTLFVPTAPYVVPSRNGTTRYYNGQYHYGGRADTYFHIGQALGRGVLTLAQDLETAAAG